MKDRLRELLDKYWQGESSLPEENELRILLKETDSYPELKEFFSGIDQLAQMDMGTIQPEISRRSVFGFFLKIAAVFIGLVIIGGLIYSDYHHRQQEKAFLQVMEAFALIQTNMEKGTTELHIMSEMHHLNKAHELFITDELKE